MNAFVRVFGDPLPVLVPWDRAKDKPYIKYSNGVEPDDYYIKSLEKAILDGGSIHVQLGSKSRNLCCVDIDSDDLIEPFEKLNAWTKTTFQRRGSKGKQYFCYATDGDHPKEVQRIVIDGSSSGTGEFRGDQLAAVWGIHRKGMRYEWVNDVAVIDLAFKDVKWPKGWTRGKAEKDQAIDWDKFNEMCADCDGDVVESLVAEYFEGAVERDGVWRCADLTGR